jgi:hypothetical protein
MANDFQIQAKQLTTSFASFVPGIDTATTNQTVHAIYFSNITTASVDVYLRLYDNDTPTAITGGYILFKVPVPASSTLVIEKPINLVCSATASQTRTLWAKASTATAIDAVASVLVMTA